MRRKSALDAIRRGLLSALDRGLRRNGGFVTHTRWNRHGLHNGDAEITGSRHERVHGNVGRVVGHESIGHGSLPDQALPLAEPVGGPYPPVNEVSNALPRPDLRQKRMVGIAAGALARKLEFNPVSAGPTGNPGLARLAPEFARDEHRTANKQIGQA